MTTTTTPTGTSMTTHGRLVTLARFDSYAGAQRLVDQLSDARFPVERIRIVGNGVRTVEDVTGRMTKGRAALYGAGTGAWVGLFVALLFAILTIGPAWWGVLVTAVPLAALFGALAGFLGHWSTGGHRDFSAVTSLRADEYEVQVDAGLHEEALRLAAHTAR
jgi:hypothetical protein